MTEDLVAGVWAEALGLESVGIRDDFVTVGGDSLAAVRIAAMLSARLRLRIGPEMLLMHPSVAALSQALSGKRGRAWSAFTIQSGGEPAVAVVHPGGSRAFELRSWARAGISNAIVALRPVARNCDGHLIRRLDQLLETYALEPALRDYSHLVVVGWSSGGVIAPRLADYLRTKGRSVELVVRVDSPPAGHFLPIRLDHIAMAGPLGRWMKISGDVPHALTNWAIEPGASSVQMWRAVVRLREQIVLLVTKLHRAGLVQRDVRIADVVELYEGWARFLVLASQCNLAAPDDVRTVDYVASGSATGMLKSGTREDAIVIPASKHDTIMTSAVFIDHLKHVLDRHTGGGVP